MGHVKTAIETFKRKGNRVQSTMGGTWVTVLVELEDGGRMLI
jgi:hypothetical protein